MAPPDPVFGLIESFRRDPRPNKVNMGIGVYTDDNGDPFVFPIVRKVSKLGSISLCDLCYSFSKLVVVENKFNNNMYHFEFASFFY